MSSTSPEQPLGIDRDRPIPATWALVSGLVLTHVLTAVIYAPVARVPLWIALFGNRGRQLRIVAGGQFAPLIDDERWRLVRSVFLHADGLHLLLNVLGLWVIGRFIEPWIGSVRFAFWFVAAGVGGSIASHAVGLQQSDGASGGAFGLFTALIVLSFRNRARLHPEDRKTLLVWMPLLLLANTLVGLFVPVIDGIAHLGGLFTGLLLAGTVTGRPAPWVTLLEALCTIGLVVIAVTQLSL